MAVIGLLALPHEILMLVRSKIHTLRDHVNLSRACRTTMALYDESFWKFACIVSGWGIPTRLQASLSHDASIKPWGAIARAVVKDARLFRGQTIDELKKYALMKTIFENEMGKPGKVRAWTPKEVEKHNIKLKAFPDHSHGGPGGFTLMIGGPADEDDIMDHPYICYRFLTVPPIKTAYISSGFGPDEDDSECIHNKLGVTVQDAFTSIIDELQAIYDAYEIQTDHTFWEGLGHDGNCYFSGSWGS